MFAVDDDDDFSAFLSAQFSIRFYLVGIEEGGGTEVEGGTALRRRRYYSDVNSARASFSLSFILSLSNSREATSSAREGAPASYHHARRRRDRRVARKYDAIRPTTKTEKEESNNNKNDVFFLSSRGTLRLLSPVPRSSGSSDPAPTDLGALFLLLLLPPGLLRRNDDEGSLEGAKQQSMSSRRIRDAAAAGGFPRGRC